MADGNTNVVYELYILEGTQWEYYAHFPADKRRDAVEQAKEVERLPHVRAVRVLKETYDDQSGLFRDFTVYRSSRTDHEPTLSRAKQRPKTSRTVGEAQASNWASDEFKPKFRRRPQISIWFVLIKLIIVMLFCLALAALFMGFASFFLGKIDFLAAMVSPDTRSTVLFFVFLASFVFLVIPTTMVFVSRDEWVALGSGMDSGSAAKPARRPARSPLQDRLKAEREASEKEDEEAAAEVEPPAEAAPKETVPEVPETAPPEPEREPDSAGQPETEAPEAKKERAYETIHEIATADRSPSAENEADDAGSTAEDEEAALRAAKEQQLAEKLEAQKIVMITFLGRVLSRLSEGRTSLDTFNKFGVNLFLAGAAQHLGKERGLDDTQTTEILRDVTVMMGMPRRQSELFAEKHGAYLMEDPRYLRIYQTGRDIMGAYLQGDPDAANGLGRALSDWNAGPGESEPELVTVLFTDIVGSTGMTQKRGDDGAQIILRAHNVIVRRVIGAFGGREVKHTGDGIMASFQSTLNGVRAAIMIMQQTAAYNKATPDGAFGLRIGINVGEPIVEDNDLFGSTVQLAARACAQAEVGGIMVTDVVRGVSSGKNIRFENRGTFDLKGFSQPVPLHAVLWEAEGDAGQAPANLAEKPVEQGNPGGISSPESVAAAPEIPKGVEQTVQETVPSSQASSPDSVPGPAQPAATPPSQSQKLKN